MLEDQVRRFILDELAGPGTRTLGNDEALFESVLDSTSVLALVTFLEQRFQIEIGDHEVVPGNFATLRRIGDYLRVKTGAGTNTQEAALPPLAANG